MNLSLGIVGLPNVGKSTLFNSLTAQAVPAENYPFTTIEPNVGIVPVNDKRLNKLSEIEKSGRIVPAIVKFVDIAGLVRGASKGEGLGNQFLSHIREVDTIVEVIRSFEDSNVTHVDKTIDPARDRQTIETELIFKDTEVLEKKLHEFERDSKGNKKLLLTVKHLEGLLHHLNSGKLANEFPKSENNDTKKIRKEIFLLTDKPILYLINETQDKINEKRANECRTKIKLSDNQSLILLDIKLEEEISKLKGDEQKEFLNDLGLTERPLDKLVRVCYKLLGLISFFTAGEMEVRAWTIYDGDSIVEAAGTIHTDFANKFIAADVVSYNNFVEYGGWQKCKDVGKIRLEGKEYIVKDGDVIIIRHGA